MLIVCDGAQNDASNAEKVAGAERQALDQIVGKYNISEEDIKSKPPSAGYAWSAAAWSNIQSMPEWGCASSSKRGLQGRRTVTRCLSVYSGC